MEVVIEILKNYWQPILAALLFILSFILQLLKKKPLSNVYSLVIRYCLAAVCMAEEHHVSGKEKKQLAIDAVKELVLDEYPTLDFSKYVDFVSNCIEAILSTPQKKVK